MLSQMQNLEEVKLGENWKNFDVVVHYISEKNPDTRMKAMSLS